MKKHLSFWLILFLTTTVALPAAAQDDDETAEEVPEEEQESTFTDYVEMTPAFVTHIGEPSERPAYLKTDISLRVKSETARDAIETHMPRLRHELVMLFGEENDLDTLSSAEGQRNLRLAAQDRVNQVLEEQQTGEEVVDVLFSTFVIQRR